MPCVLTLLREVVDHRLPAIVICIYDDKIKMCIFGLNDVHLSSKLAVAPQFTNGEDFLDAFLGKKRGSRSRATGN